MNAAELAKQLHDDERIVINGTHASVVNKENKTTATYLIGPGGDLWLDTTNLISDPPPGFCKITNQYWDPKERKVVVEIDNKVVT